MNDKVTGKLTDKSIWRAFSEAFSALGHGVVWVPLAVYFLIKISLIPLYMETIRGPLAGAWTVALDPDMQAAVGHYPWNFVLMPVILGRLDLVLDVLLHVVFQGVTLLLFISVLMERDPSLRKALRKAAGRYLSLLIAALVTSLALFLWFKVTGMTRGFGMGLPRAVEIAGTAAVGIALQALFVYAIPFILVEGESPFRAILRSTKTALRTFDRSYLLVFIPFLLTVPMTALALKSRSLAEHLTPEVLVPVQVGQDVGIFLSTLILLGTLSALFARR